MKNLIVRFVHDDTGQDLIEYALLAGTLASAPVRAEAAIAGAAGAHAPAW